MVRGRTPATRSTTEMRATGAAGTDAMTDNADALKPVYEEWGQGNFRPRFEVYARDMEWGYSEEFLEIAGVSAESGDTSDRLRRWLSSWRDWRVIAEDFLTSGDTVVVMARYTGVGRGSGLPLDVEGAHVWTFRDGEAVRLEIFADRARALESAGLLGTAGR
jgi:uncharacterized protein